MKEQFPNYAEKAAIAAKYGWKISGWAVDLDNPAGISLYPIHGGEHLRMQHKDSLKVWEATLSKCPKPLKASKGRKPPTPKTFDDVVFALRRIVELEPGSRGAYQKFVEAQKIAKAALP